MSIPTKAVTVFNFSSKTALNHHGYMRIALNIFILFHTEVFTYKRLWVSDLFSFFTDPFQTRIREKIYFDHYSFLFNFERYLNMGNNGFLKTFFQYKIVSSRDT